MPFQDTRFNATAEIRTPWGKADVQSIDYAATVDLEILNDTTVANFGTLTGNITVGVSSVPNEIDQLNTLVVIFTADGSDRTVTMGDLIVPAADATVVTAGTTVQITLQYVNAAYTIISKVVV